MVGGAEADGAVVVAFFRWARRHLFLRRRVEVSTGALCLPAVDPLCRPDFAGVNAAAFFMTDAKLPDPESGEPHRYRPAK